MNPSVQHPFILAREKKVSLLGSTQEIQEKDTNITNLSISKPITVAKRMRNCDWVVLSHTKPSNATEPYGVKVT